MAKRHRFDFDGALKQYFETERPGLLSQLTRGVGVKEFLNVELPSVRSRRVDLLILLNNDTILHIEFQSHNHRDMALRMAEYYFLLVRKYKKPVRQVVIYLGAPKMSMPRRHDSESVSFCYELRDIRSWNADDLLESDHEADYVLAMLAGGREDSLQLIRDVLVKIGEMSGPAKEKALAFAGVLSGLRGFERIVFEETIRMGQVIDWKKNEILRNLYAEGVELGVEQGLEQGMSKIVRTVLTATFGPLPKWAQERIARANAVQLELWAANAVGSKSLESVLGPK